MVYKRFEYWDLEPNDFRVEVYAVIEKGMRVSNRSGVKIELLPYDVVASCHSHGSQIKNRDECLNTLETILSNHGLK